MIYSVHLYTIEKSKFNLVLEYGTRVPWYAYSM